MLSHVRMGSILNFVRFFRFSRLVNQAFEVNQYFGLLPSHLIAVFMLILDSYLSSNSHRRINVSLAQQFRNIKKVPVGL